LLDVLDLVASCWFFHLILAWSLFSFWVCAHNQMYIGLMSPFYWTRQPTTYILSSDCINRTFFPVYLFFSSYGL
jgi:hypothetical protein